MKTDWEVKTLGEVCQFVNGRAYKKPELLSEGKYPVLRVGNFFTNDHWYYSDLELDKDKYCDDGDLLYAWSASFGPRIWQGGKVIYHYHIWKLIPNLKLISKEFLFHLLYWDVDKIKEDQGKGTTMTHVGKGSIESRSVYLPPLSEQQRIVAILDEAFAAIDKAKENAQKNLQNARALFESYLQSVFAKPGEGWEEKRIGEIGTTQYGLSESMNTDSNGYKIFRMGEVQNGLLVDTGRMKYAAITKEEFEKYRLNDGDILFNRTNSFELVGKTGIFKLKGDYCFASYLIRLKYDSKLINPWFLNHLMNSSGFQKEIKKKAAKSVNQANINATILSNERIIIPPLDEQQTIVAKLDALSAETKKLEAIYQQKLTDLDELKKAILQKAFQGELSKTQGVALCD